MRLETSGATLLEGPCAFFVELMDSSASVGGDDANGEIVPVSDPRALYQGIFWQVFKNFRPGWTAGCCTVELLGGDNRDGIGI